MTRQSTARHKPVSASEILKALGDDLGTIRHEDKLTFVDLGRVLGKSDDQAAKYVDGTAEMPVTAFYFAKQAWNGRFTGSADALVGVRGADLGCDREREGCILKAALALSIALADGDISVAEIRENRPTLEAAADAIAGLLGRLKPVAA